MEARLGGVLDADQEQLEHLHYLESMELIDRAIRRTTDLEQMLRDVIETVFSLFDCDRAWLVHPCDPQAPSYRVHMESTRPEYPGAGVLNIDVPMVPSTIADARRALQADGPVTSGAGCGYPVAEDTARRFGVRSQISMAIHPKVGKPWLIGMHQCSRDRVWAAQEQRLFTAIGRRIADALSTLLVLRDLAASEAKYRTLVENLPQAVFLKDADLVYVSCNEHCAHELGINAAEIAGMTDYELFSRELAESYRATDRRIIASGQSVEIEDEHVQGGKLRTFQVLKTPVTRDDGAVVGVLGVAWDITDRRRAEEERRTLESQLRRSQRLEAIGQLAGGVAHDFNNLLTAILGNTELTLSLLDTAEEDEGPPLRHGLLEIQRGALRAAELTRQLMAFSHQQVTQPEILDLNRILAEIETMLRRLIAESIELVTYPAADLSPIRADAGQIEQVIVNLVINASDAMADGGRVILRTTNVAAVERSSRSNHSIHGEISAGPHVVLEVSDTGCGMDDETRERLCEPFFTTKPVGKGTGLGLSTVYGIITKIGGHLSVESEIDKGTRIRAYLPTVDEPVSVLPDVAVDAAELGGNETILVCEDDDSVRKVAVDILNDAGYRVLEAANGRDALRLAAEHAGCIQLLVTDVIMPEMNGRQLAEQLTATYPGTRTLFVSGYPLHVINKHGELEEGVELLEKPFSSTELLHRVRAELSRIEE